MNFKNIKKGHFLKCLIIVSLLLLNLVVAQTQDDLEKAHIELTYDADSTSKTIMATATDIAGEPIGELELYFYVQRTFGLLPIGDEFSMTDEEGLIEVEFPMDLPGDREGNLEIVVKLKDSDLYEDQTIKVTKDWGVPSIITKTENERSLWAASANAPIALIIMVNSMIAFVYLIIFYIIFVLFKISRIN